MTVIGNKIFTAFDSDHDWASKNVPPYRIYNTEGYRFETAVVQLLIGSSTVAGVSLTSLLVLIRSC
jgi:hypothetical protein